MVQGLGELVDIFMDGYKAQERWVVETLDRIEDGETVPYHPNDPIPVIPDPMRKGFFYGARWYSVRHPKRVLRAAQARMDGIVTYLLSSQTPPKDLPEATKTRIRRHYDDISFRSSAAMLCGAIIGAFIPGFTQQKTGGTVVRTGWGGVYKRDARKYVEKQRQSA